MAIGIFSQPTMLAHLVAGSARFQSKVGAANATEAFNNYIARYRALGSSLKPPRAIISCESQAYTNNALGNFQAEAQLELSFEFKYDIPDETQAAVNASYDAFEDDIETIIKEMSELCRTGEPVTGYTYPNVTNFVMLAEPEMEPVAEGDMEDPEGDTTQQLIWFVVFNVEII